VLPRTGRNAGNPNELSKQAHEAATGSTRATPAGRGGE